MNGAITTAHCRFTHGFRHGGVSVAGAGQIFSRTTKLHQHSQFMNDLTSAFAEQSCYIDEFIAKYGSLAQAYNDGGLNEKEQKSAIKGRIPVWAACFQAMRSWPSIEADEINCAKLLVAGTKNKSVTEWLEGNAESLPQAGVQVALLEGLNHPQEFSQIDRVYPVVESFLHAL